MFNVFALALPRGLSFGDNPPVSAWRSVDWLTVGALTKNRHSDIFGVLVMRRRDDEVWVVLCQEDGAFTEEQAMDIISRACREEGARVPVPPGAKRRPPLAGSNSTNLSPIFLTLAQPCRERGAWMLNQLYLAMPNPDDNWASDCRSGNFHARLWEALLFASLKEQGLLVTQSVRSPDFYVANRTGLEGWIEAVTANPPVAYDHANSEEVAPPEDRRERMLGAAAVRYAKTLRSKLDRGYAQMPHVRGKPFVIAIADFHAPGSMTWSRAALMGYLYGFYVEEMDVAGKRVAVPEPIGELLGSEQIPAGLFLTPEGEELSAVLFSQGATLAKLSRVPISFGGSTGDYRYVRMGEFADFTPGAMQGKPFCMDVNSDEYRSLWHPYDYEPWTAEVEVFHNPWARQPIDPRLLPEATHWLPIDGEMDCKCFFKESVLRSRTLIQPASKPIPTLSELGLDPSAAGTESMVDDVSTG